MKWGNFRNCKRMDWPRILSCSSFLITDQACPGTNVLARQRYACSTPSVYPKWQHLPKSNQANNRPAVSFVDFGPNMFNLTSTSTPSHMQGRPFLEKYRNEKKICIRHRDRDEVRDLPNWSGIKYLYIRNYMPHLGYNQPTAWPDIGEIRHEFAN